MTAFLFIASLCLVSTAAQDCENGSCDGNSDTNILVQKQVLVSAMDVGITVTRGTNTHEVGVGPVQLLQGFTYTQVGGSGSVCAPSTDSDHFPLWFRRWDMTFDSCKAKADEMASSIAIGWNPDQQNGLCYVYFPDTATCQSDPDKFAGWTNHCGLPARYSGVIVPSGLHGGTYTCWIKEATTAQAPPAPAPQVVTDTPGWGNGYGFDCTGYATQGWCASGSFVPGNEWTGGAKYKFPEQNCIVCGKKAPPKPGKKAEETCWKVTFTSYPDQPYGGSDWVYIRGSLTETYSFNGCTQESQDLLSHGKTAGGPYGHGKDCKDINWCRNAGAYCGSRFGGAHVIVDSSGRRVSWANCCNTANQKISQTDIGCTDKCGCQA